MSRSKKPVIAFVYDFDGTLSPGNMQEHSFLPSVGISPKPFWDEVKKLARDSDGDEILIYLKQMIDAARAAKKPISKASFKEHGKKVALFDGVEEWFSRINKLALDRGLRAEHYIISSGVREILEGTSIAKSFKRIFASSYYYDANGVAEWPALAINYTNKTQFLFRINKGTLDVWDHSHINKFVERSERHVPFDRIVFFGDGETDIPCMRLVTEQGGYAVAIYPPNKRNAKKKVQSLIQEQRARFIAKADYSENGQLNRIAKTILDDVAARLAISRLAESP